MSTMAMVRDMNRGREGGREREEGKGQGGKRVDVDGDCLRHRICKFDAGLSAFL